MYYFTGHSYRLNWRKIACNKRLLYLALLTLRWIVLSRASNYYFAEGVWWCVVVYERLCKRPVNGLFTWKKAYGCERGLQ